MNTITINLDPMWLAFCGGAVVCLVVIILIMVALSKLGQRIEEHENDQ